MQHRAGRDAMRQSRRDGPRDELGRDIVAPIEGMGPFYPTESFHQGCHPQDPLSYRFCAGPGDAQRGSRLCGATAPLVDVQGTTGRRRRTRAVAFRLPARAVKLTPCHGAS